MQASSTVRTNEWYGVYMITPHADNILIRIEPQPAMTASGIHLAHGKPKLTATRTAVIVAVGPGRYHPDSGVLMPTQVRAGERVVVLATAGQTLQDYGWDLSQPRGNAHADLDASHRIVREDELIAVLYDAAREI